MTREELIADIATGRTVAERLPLYKAAMDLGLLNYQEIQRLVRNAEPVQKKPVAKRTSTPRKTRVSKETKGDTE
jgi:hypothetical protein